MLEQNCTYFPKYITYCAAVFYTLMFKHDTLLFRPVNVDTNLTHRRNKSVLYLVASLKQPRAITAYIELHCGHKYVLAGKLSNLILNTIHGNKL